MYVYKAFFKWLYIPLFKIVVIRYFFHISFSFHSLTFFIYRKSWEEQNLREWRGLSFKTHCFLTHFDDNSKGKTMYLGNGTRKYCRFKVAETWKKVQKLRYTYLKMSEICWTRYFVTNFCGENDRDNFCK